MNGEVEMKHELSFCSINMLDENIAEVIVNKSVKISIEMVEEYEEFLSTHFSSDFGLLINKINHYDYSFEAKLSIASNENLKIWKFGKNKVIWMIIIFLIITSCELDLRVVSI